MWNFNMDEAPKSFYKKTEATVSKNGESKVIKIETEVPVLIWAASDCGIVTISRYLNESGRWNMFTKDNPPIAWSEYKIPEHPNKKGVQ